MTRFQGNPIGDHDLQAAMFDLITKCYPICRSITGNGVRETIEHVRGIIPVATREVPSGTQVFDWNVPDEWNITQAYIKDPQGDIVVDFKRLSLHVLNYSVPVRRRVPLSELKKHIFTIPEQPELVPYRTSYYQKNWGFCMAHRQLTGLAGGHYEVVIDSTLEKGNLTYGEYLIPGATQDEVLISTHICHPSLCNDNLSGIAVSAFLARHLAKQPLRYSYRFLFLPVTIGSITWLSLNENRLDRIKHGLVITLLGDSSAFTYKKSRRGDAEIDRVMENYLKHSGESYRVRDFIPYGYDERQYCSPGFDLPVGCLTRTPHGEFPEYHTSADNLSFISPENLAASLAALLDVIFILENNHTYVNLNPKCEPMLGKRGLYAALGGSNDSKNQQLAALWVLNLSDGNHSLLDISNRSGMRFNLIKTAADALVECELLKITQQPDTP
jgi:aminopeptidase-like protein